MNPNPSGLPPEIIEPIRIVFFQECEEKLAELEQGLLALQRGERDPEIVNSVFRAAHSIKGGAGIFGYDPLVRFAHLFEAAMEEVRAGRQALDPEPLKTLLRAGDVLSDHVMAAHDGVPPPDARPLEQALARLIGVREDPVEEAPSAGLDFAARGSVLEAMAAAPQAQAERRWRVRFKPHAGLYAKAGEPLLLLRELERLGAMEVSLDARDLPPLQDLDPEQAYLAWTVSLLTGADEVAIRAVFEFVEGDCDLEVGLQADEAPPEEDDQWDGFIPTPAPAFVPIPAPTHDAAPEPAPQAEEPQAAPPPTPHAESLRVDLGRVDKLIDLAGELVITQAVLAQRVSEAGLSGESEVGMALEELTGLARDLQESVMAIRSQSVKSVFQRMSRLVRELETATGKQAELTLVGEATEVDRTVIERLTDPLTHMVRNAIDHGLESPEQRLAKGKPERGALRISAAHRAGRIVIEVADDGAGVDRARVKAVAAERGLIDPVAQLSDEEADNLIFLPGFSTAREVSDLSGRGVGLDVVKRGVQALGGRISLASRPGEGSTFTLSLPLTLAVLDGMVVSVRGQSLVVPLNAILESIQAAPGDIHRLGPAAALLAYRGEQVPLLDLGEVLGLGCGLPPPPITPAKAGAQSFPERPSLPQGGDSWTDLDPGFRRGGRGGGEPSPRKVALLVEDDTGRRAALLIDDILDQRQVVIKSLEANYRRVAGVAAATILGDGRVALILDVDGVIAGRSRHPERRAASA